MHLSSTRKGYKLMRIYIPELGFFPLEILGANIATSIQRPPVLCDLFSKLPSMVAIDKFDYSTKFRPNRGIFVFWQSFWIQNDRHSKPKWSQYGAACLTPCKYPFPLKFFHFWIFNDFLIFILAAILKILKTKSTTLSDDLFLCQVSKGSAVWSEFNIFCTLVTMATAAIFDFFQPLKSCHTLRWIFL
jgi:hypothetical protein